MDAARNAEDIGVDTSSPPKMDAEDPSDTAPDRMDTSVDSGDDSGRPDAMPSDGGMDVVDAGPDVAVDTRMPPDTKDIGVDTMPDSSTPDTAPDTSGLPQPAMAGQLVISEFMADPDTLSDKKGEWFELYNPSATVSYDLQSCVLADRGSDSHAISKSVVVAPQSYVILSKGTSPGATPAYVYPKGWYLANSGDEIIVKCGGTVIDEVDYDMGPNFTNPKKGASKSLDPTYLNAMDNDDGMYWCDGQNSYNGDKGSPAKANSNCP